MPGKFCWNELMTPDLEASKKFYCELFGWETKEMDMGGGFIYTMFRPAGAPEDQSCGGMLQISPEMGDCPPHWLSYVMVENTAESVEKAKALGATVIKDVTDIGMGIFAIVTDPTGAAFAFWQQGADCDE